MGYVLLIVGLALLAASARAAWLLKRVAVAERPALWRKAFELRWRIGLVLMFASPFVRFRVGTGEDRWTIFGVPFATFTYDVDGLEYVGYLTGPFFFLNALFWLLLPQLLLWITSLRHRMPAADTPTP